MNQSAKTTDRNFTELVSTHSWETNPKLRAVRMLITCFANKLDLLIICRFPPLLTLNPPSLPSPKPSTGINSSSFSNSLFSSRKSKLVDLCCSSSRRESSLGELPLITLELDLGFRREILAGRLREGDGDWTLRFWWSLLVPNLGVWGWNWERNWNEKEGSEAQSHIGRKFKNRAVPTASW